MNPQEFDELLSKYADVLVHIGLSVRKDQILSIRGILEDAPLIRKVTASAYKAGAKYVDVQWNDELTSRLRFEHADPESITYIPDWIFHFYEDYMKNGEAQLAIASNDPDLFEGIDSDLLAKSRKARMLKFEPLRKYENISNWCVAASAAPSWAKKVFPGMPIDEAQDKLWAAIFKACRIDTTNPVAAWQAHTDRLTKYKDFLNNKCYTALHYLAPGTDLTIGLPEKQVWSGAQESFKNGITCTVNIPTEEVFTAPHKDKVNGHVKATLPLNLGGTLIEDFTVTFENGCVTKLTAQKGESDLRKLIEMDENASRLGEAALVPDSSPIKQSGILFFNTLFDENASCHIAFGNAYRTSIVDGADMTDEEFAAAGGNKSLVHTDFMIGSDKMDIDGIQADGTREPVMRSGEWAINV